MHNVIVFSVLIFTFLSFSQNANATSYTAIKSGEWNDPATWGGGNAPTTVNPSDTITIPDGFIITNHGKIEDSGAISNYGTINNNAGGTFNNHGFIFNRGIINNSGNPPDDNATINNDGVISNSGVLGNFDALINNNAGGVIINNNHGSPLPDAGTIYNFGDVENYGTITNIIDSIIENFGIIHNNCSGVINNSGTVTGFDIVETCIQKDTIIVVTSNLNPSIFGYTITFTATVSSSGGTPTGTVDFKDGTTTIGSGTLDGAGIATLSISTLSVGTHSMTAVYLADSNFNASTSPVLSQVILTPAQAVNTLANLANSMRVQSSSLHNTQKLLNDNVINNDNGACGKLGAFIHEVNANKKLTQDQKNLLIGQANTIKTAIGC